MTTFNAYIDALANAPQSRASRRLRWLLTTRVQVGLLYAVDGIVIVASLLIAIFAAGMLPFAPNTDAEQ